MLSHITYSTDIFFHLDISVTAMLFKHIGTINSLLHGDNVYAQIGM